ncbi:MAG: hypothetical protein K6D03_04960, partial [Solobacterium sp.]|nr:hypothetical protein [Solobacterium sp.]
MNKYLLGIDNGGSDIKCALFDTEGTEIASSNVQVPIAAPAPGYTERDAEEVWQANAEAVRETLKKAEIDPGDICAVGITAYGNGMVLADENVRPVYPVIVSTDDRAAELCSEFKKNGTERKLFPHT